ncbi:hypothetical protein AVEN_184024-1 [Araneus ventricosus]|uniref:Histone-lysine N-methyltransferase SETMAR n=1 Tax=Araneus ventricosus TaxID=182803 RepID=A0A4Y2H840_ARAVE|nr:hypothetical protein AVEN_184024-1 [Araneus ventricosus]
MYCVPKGQTIHQQYCTCVLTTEHEGIEKNHSDLWKNGLCLIHQNNTSTQNSMPIKTHLAKYGISFVEQQPYSPDITPCDFFLFPHAKSELKETRFQSEDTERSKQR